MKAQNLTISIPSPDGCNKSCPYCVSDMTGHIKPNWGKMTDNVKKVRKLADTAGVNNVLITSKGEPTMYMDEVVYIAREFGDFPLEIQTNGRLLLKKANRRWTIGDDDLSVLDWLIRGNIDILAVSIDKAKEFEILRPALIEASERGMIVRLCININEFLKQGDNDFTLVKNIFDYAQQIGAKQILFRKLSVPEGAEDTKYANWIYTHAPDSLYDGMISQLGMLLDTEGKLMRHLVTGEGLYEIRGMSVTRSDHCIQERSNGVDDIRSLIFLEDGHVYTSWNSRAPLF